MAEIAALKYRAFLSYNHGDTAWAKWLHGELEDYRIDKDLVGRKRRSALCRRHCGRSFATARTLPRATRYAQF